MLKHLSKARLGRQKSSATVSVNCIVIHIFDNFLTDEFFDDQIFPRPPKFPMRSFSPNLANATELFPVSFSSFLTPRPKQLVFGSDEKRTKAASSSWVKDLKVQNQPSITVVAI